MLENNWDEFVLVESIIDPYGLVEKINRLTQDQDAQGLIETVFDQYLQSKDQRINDLLVIYFKKVNN
jgi:hypothetical protein